MKGLLTLDQLQYMPAVRYWLAHAEATRRIIQEKYQHLTDIPLLTAATQENVLVQLEHLRTHPAVASGLAAGNLKLHGWVYKIETGEVFAFDPSIGQFVRIADKAPVAIAPPQLAAAAI
jgi:carbonic anhydrase